MTVQMPAARAREISGAMGSVTAVGEVTWLMKRTRVFGVTPAQTASITSSGSSIGTGSFWTTTRDWRCSDTNVHVRSSWPYSWVVVSTSSPGSTGTERATMFNAAVTLGTQTTSC